MNLNQIFEAIDNRYENTVVKFIYLFGGPHWADVSNAPYGRYHKTTSGQELIPVL